MICLNVGCNNIHLKDFVNIDIDKSMNPDVEYDARKLKDLYSENSVDFIYCGHFLEHFDIETVNNIVQDFLYILKPYGSIVAVVPDYSKTNDMNVYDAERIIMGAGEHKILINQDRLVSMIKNAGFKSVFRVDVKDLPWCRFKDVPWQSAVLAVKHESIEFTTG